ncbi:hypothetical protein TPADAL_0344a [Treponema pallidum subsp. pallidum DAL-1]|uniref:Secreted protein n=2 Tax=Treponema pallidum TaxID=160 RepID=A0AAU8RWP3_TREPL|nr:hypothetical protein TPESAMD_0344a [Treponema pallidum subsp. pertenue str. SamoaD]AEZ58529.1 hypothetical protein TPECDC2_0344a [Treponema pallidum subsp. pertenue str. CDC2]AEZ59597.1 hypothetical protein TPEGAU_0344a [Treponema pallidum subsp. pertenue str. Gauthier]AEZ60661.1 hypothetical protein TPADAL_0344a [Treponema pallidum subsp. pallidum DAL-1]AGK83984.1 hypothetical protein TPFB_0344a [Treponema pallidum str. Fribourg-Blanc]AJB40358.1 hypothetical protein TENDBA_0344a [Treponema
MLLPVLLPCPLLLHPSRSGTSTRHSAPLHSAVCQHALKKCTLVPRSLCVAYSILGMSSSMRCARCVPHAFPTALKGAPVDCGPTFLANTCARVAHT